MDIKSWHTVHANQPLLRSNNQKEIIMKNKHRNIADTFKTFPNYVGFEFMTYESSFLQELEITSKKELLEYAAEQLPEDQIIVWFRGHDPIAMVAAGDIEITVLDKKANLYKVVTTVQGARVADSNKIRLICSIYPMELISDSLGSLETADAIEVCEFTSPPNTLQFKGYYSSRVGNTDTVFMLCVEAGPIGLPVEIDRLTWKSTTFGPTRRPLYITSELYQLSIADSEAMKVIAHLVNKPVGSCISKAEAADISTNSIVTRYFQKGITFAEINKLNKHYAMTAQDKLVILHRVAGRTSYEMIDATQFEI
jgi:hypothetical protein